MEPSPARIYNYWLGGKDHFAVDRQVADHLAAVAPCVVPAARANRAFVRRAASVMARAGVVQFLDLGCGLPVGPAVHEVAHRAGVDARVVYVDRDEVVLAHARALWGGAAGVAVLPGDVRDLTHVLEDPRCRAYLDRSRPVGVLLAGVVHGLTDEEVAVAVGHLGEALVPGSYLAITHPVGEPVARTRGRGAAARRTRSAHRAAATREAARLHAELVGPCRLRTREQVASWFEGWPLIEPGLTDVGAWRRLPGGRRPKLPAVAGVGRREG